MISVYFLAHASHTTAARQTGSETAGFSTAPITRGLLVSCLPHLGEIYAMGIQYAGRLRVFLLTRRYVTVFIGALSLRQEVAFAPSV
jgi:hypothetical protein